MQQLDNNEREFIVSEEWSDTGCTATRWIVGCGALSLLCQTTALVLILFLNGGTQNVSFVST